MRAGFFLPGFVLVLYGAAQAQVITGSLVGKVMDETGAVLPGATITLASPALIGGPSELTANPKGQYRFPNLAPGIYTLEVSLSGFASYREEDIRVLVGGTVERNVVLKLPGVEETVLVSGQSPLVDTHKAGMSTNVGSESLENTPVRRFSVYDLMKSAPGVSATRPSGGQSFTFSVFGSGWNENAYLYDGANFASPWSGEPWPLPSPDVAEEIEIVSLGASAEYGNIQGAVLNVVTKQGGNDFRFSAAYYGQAQSLTSQPVFLDCACPEGESGYNRNRYRDLTAQVGGPILKDRLWFFAAYQYLRDSDSQPGADPRFPREYENDNIAWKINWQVTPRLSLMHSFHEDFWVWPGTPSVSSPYETTATQDGHNPTSTFAKLTHILSDNTLWEARISGFLGPGDLTPNSGSLTVPVHLDIATGLWSGNAPWFASYDQKRISAQGKLSHYATDFLAADHDFKFGVQYEHGSTHDFWGYTGGVHYLDYAGEPYLGYLRQPYSYGGQFDTLGAFAEDVVRIGKRLTVNLGLRFDRNEAVSPDIPEVDEAGRETGGTIAGLGTIYTWNVVSPRLGFNYQLTEDGRTVLRASYGRFYQGIFTGEIGIVHPGLTPTTIAFYDPSTGGFTDVVAVIDPLADVGVDPDSRPPNTDQFSIGVDRELTRDLAMSITYVRKEGRDFIAWKDVGGVYGTDTATLQDGSTITVYPLLNSPSERFYLLTNRDELYLRYNGLLFTLEKRWSDGWQAQASYSLSEAVGLQASSWFGAGGGQTSSTFGANWFGRDPNDLTNADGNLPNDRTHMFRVQGSVEIPKLGVLAAAHYQYLTGKPWGAWTNLRLPQGTVWPMVEPRGSRRLSSQSLLDLRLSKIFRFGGRTRIELLVDILNLFNETAEEGFVTENIFSDNFEEPNGFVDPRRAMIGVKFSY